MADRSAARMMGRVFITISKNPTKQNIELAHGIYDNMGQVDFDQNQMQADEALQILGLAKKGVHPDWDDDEYWYYKGDVDLTKVIERNVMTPEDEKALEQDFTFHPKRFA